MRGMNRTTKRRRTRTESMAEDRLTFQVGDDHGSSSTIRFKGDVRGSYVCKMEGRF